jgi:hypothetical protein
MNEAALLAAIKSGTFTTIDEVLAKCDWLNEDYPNLMAAVCPQMCTRTELRKLVERSKRSAKVTATLGLDPQTPAEFIEHTALTLQVTLDEKDADRPLTWLDPHEGATRALCQDGFMQEVLNVHRNVLASRWALADVRGQVEYFLGQLRKELRNRIYDHLCNQPIGTFDWQTYICTSYDQTSQTWEYQAAILQKWIWMVKRKLSGIPVTHHICPVIFGSQGKGKTVGVELLYGPLGWLATSADFSRLGDAREAGIFDRYVIFLDEMSKASGAEWATIKNAITRPTYSYRPMGTNDTIEKVQNASFIGTSNKLLSQLIADTTGNRRFVELHFNNHAGAAEHAIINNTDYLAMWRSVDHRAEDPSKPFWKQIADEQLEGKTFSTVELFAQYLTDNHGEYQADEGFGRDISLKPMKWEDLFHCYRKHCKALHFSHPLELHGFRQEMQRLIREHGSSWVFTTKRTSQFNGVEYVGPHSRPQPNPQSATPSKVMAALGMKP